MKDNESYASAAESHDVELKSKNVELDFQESEHEPIQ